MSAHWMTAAQAQEYGLYEGRNNEGLVEAMLVGADKQGHLLWYRGDGHTMIVAPPGAGKGQGFVLPNCVLYQGSMLVIDPKGENAAMTALHRRDKLKQPVYVIDPFDLSGIPSASFNPLDWLLTTEPKYFFPDCDLLARALVASEAAQYAHFHDEAVNLMRALILFLYAHEPQNLNLNRLYDLAFGDPEHWERLFELMSESEVENADIRRVVRSAGNWYMGLDPKAQDQHRSTVQKNLQWLAGSALPDVVRKSDFDVKQLKSRPSTIYLCIPGESRELYKPYVRCLVTLVLLGMYRTKGIGALPVQFMCDEFYTTIGSLEIVDSAVGDMRGYGARFAFVFQDLSQLQRLYPETWKLVESSCGAVIYIGAENETGEHVSKRLGEEEYTQQPGGVFFAGDVDRKAQLGRRPLMTPQQIKELGERKEIILMQYRPPLICHRVTASEDERFKAFLGENPMRRQAALRDNAHVLGSSKPVRSLEDYVAERRGTASRTIDEQIEDLLAEEI
jgi:type IV secretion system protein VirD4